ncbi:uncharacterized protein EAF01_007232 [Botrytis porri]|uniref:uncharacterized protein n=1 Tax=Botrytis porri TaxID=87229 RepID=UPI00190134BC|nr:uncharacterized protein EAF01_007232 [Botrytis porri]KAF7901934.1 hypothetical protein EAF01_007232 [Botrytis porri]
MEGSSKNKIAETAVGKISSFQPVTIWEVDKPRGTGAIFISYITVAWPDGLKGSWMGDWGYFCGGPWYPAQTISNIQDNYTLKCTWIDSDGSNGIGIKRLGIHITDFTPTIERLAVYQMTLSSKPRFRMYDDINTDTYLPYFDPFLKFKQKTLLDVYRALVVGVECSKLDCNPLPPVPSPCTRGTKKRKPLSFIMEAQSSAT